MNWRPDNWEQSRHLDLAGTTNIVLTAKEIELYEAGADAMHQADVEWLEEKVLFIGIRPVVEGIPVTYVGCYVLKWGHEANPEIGFNPLADEEDWQAFKGDKH